MRLKSRFDKLQEQLVLDRKQVNTLERRIFELQSDVSKLSGKIDGLDWDLKELNRPFVCGDFRTIQESFWLICRHLGVDKVKEELVKGD